MDTRVSLVGYTNSAGAPTAGVLIGAHVIPAEEIPSQSSDPTSVIAMIRSWDSVHARLHAAEIAGRRRALGPCRRGCHAANS